MGSISGGSGGSSQKSRIWRGQRPFLRDLYSQGQQMLQGYDAQPALDALQQQMNPQMNPYLGAMTNQYTQALGQLDQASGRGAAAAGVFGGGRQGVEQYLNQQNIGNQVGNFLGNQYQADQARAMTAINMAPNLPFAPLANYASILGGPAILGEGSSSNRNFGFGIQGK